MKITATIQARMGSSRLPGKVLKKIVGKPMLELQIERIKQSILIDEIIIATSTSSGDDAIEELAGQIGVGCFRGSEDDVIGRITAALRANEVDIHAEFMGDNPIPDPMLIDTVIGFYLKNRDKYDYVTNALTTTYPPGAEVFIYPASTLYDAEPRVKDSAMREHVGPNIYGFPERYRIYNIEAPAGLYEPHMHFEVDTAEDFEVITAIYEHFYPDNPGFNLGQVIAYMKGHPDIIAKNKSVHRRWRKFRNE